MASRIKNLYSYLGFGWDLPSLEEQKLKGQKMFGREYNFYEHTLTELLKGLDPKTNIDENGSIPNF